MKTFYSTLGSIDVCDLAMDINHYTWPRDGPMWEKSAVEKFFSFVPRDKKACMVDVGAQSGLYTLFAKHFPNLHIHAFEPFPDSMKALKENIKLNNITNVTTYDFGVSDKCGEYVLNTSRHHNGLHTMGTNPLRFNDVVPISIKTTTIDSLNIDVDFIKIDTEGWEYNILKGAEETIKRCKPLMQIEWNETNMAQCSVNPIELKEYVTSLGYVPVSKIGEELILIHEHHKIQ